MEDEKIRKIYVYADHVVEKNNLNLEIQRTRDEIVELTPKEEKEEVEKLISDKMINAELEHLRKLLNELEIIRENLEKTK